MSLLRFLGIQPRARAGNGAAEAAAENESIRAIAAKLENLPAQQAQYLAAFAYVLARVAHADLEFAESEGAEMRRIIRAQTALPESEAQLVVEIAAQQAGARGGTDDYLVTRAFRQASTREQRLQLLHCLYAVAAADGSISAPEAAQLHLIADELGIARAEGGALRAQYRAQLAVLQKRGA